MPQTKWEEWAFAVMMVLVMVYVICLYNLSCEEGFYIGLLGKTLCVMWPEGLGALILQQMVAGPAVRRVIKCAPFSRFSARQRRVAYASLTVCIMAPCMTLLVSLTHGGFNAYWLGAWGAALMRNFLFAWALQLFAAGPLVRFLFQTLFRRRQAI